MKILRAFLRPFRFRIFLIAFLLLCAVFAAILLTTDMGEVTHPVTVYEYFVKGILEIFLFPSYIISSLSKREPDVVLVWYFLFMILLCYAFVIERIVTAIRTPQHSAGSSPQ